MSRRRTSVPRVHVQYTLIGKMTSRCGRFASFLIRRKIRFNWIVAETKKPWQSQKNSLFTPCSQSYHVSALRTQQTNHVDTDRSWQLASAVCLERFPVVTKEMDQTEQRYFDMVTAIELEKSSLSQHEVAVATDRKRMAKKQSGEYVEEDEEDQGGDLLTALDIEDLATEELARFEPAARITEADERDDRRSLNRKLSEKLVLLVKCRLGNKSVWLLPYGHMEEGQTLRETAQKALFDHCDGDSSLSVLFMGNAPVGFLKQRFPKKVQEETGRMGVKIFFFKAQYMSGDFQSAGVSPKVEDYSWVSRDELDQYLDESYLDSVRKFILPV